MIILGLYAGSIVLSLGISAVGIAGAVDQYGSCQLAFDLSGCDQSNSRSLRICIREKEDLMNRCQDEIAGSRADGKRALDSSMATYIAKIRAKIGAITTPELEKQKELNLQVGEFVRILTKLRTDFAPVQALTKDYFDRLVIYKSESTLRAAKVTSLISKMTTAELTDLPALDIEAAQLLSVDIGLSNGFAHSAELLQLRISQINLNHQESLERFQELSKKFDLPVPDFFADVLLALKKAQASLNTSVTDLKNYQIEYEKSYQTLVSRKILLTAEVASRPVLVKSALDTASSRFVGFATQLKTEVFVPVPQGTKSKFKIFGPYLSGLKKFLELKSLCADVATPQGDWKALGCGFLLADFANAQDKIETGIPLTLKTNLAFLKVTPGMTSLHLERAETELKKGNLEAAVFEYDLAVAERERL